ncbi:MAG TPA: hypothetical protein VH165_14240 [Kofleriaceae bacterium]|nr:hypothetical protein [Kofleriaceae bacterium]
MGAWSGGSDCIGLSPRSARQRPVKFAGPGSQSSASRVASARAIAIRSAAPSRAPASSPAGRSAPPAPPAPPGDPPALAAVSKPIAVSGKTRRSSSVAPLMNSV